MNRLIELMEPHLALIKLLAVLALVASVSGGLLWYHNHVFQQGVTQEKTRRDLIDIANTAKAEKELAVLNEKVRSAQAALTDALETIAARELELHHEQATSTVLQADLSAGRVRERVLVTRSVERNIAQTGQSSFSTAATMDSGTEVVEDLSPIVAVSLEKLRSNENTAIDRLEACIASYDAVKSAVDRH